MRATTSLFAHEKPRSAAPFQPALECQLCGDRVAREAWVDHRDTENFVLLEIRRLHPAWIEQDGACRRCIRAYRLLGRARSAITRPWRAMVHRAEA